jgi:hypothetical protein
MLLDETIKRNSLIYPIFSLIFIIYRIFISIKSYFVLAVSFNNIEHFVYLTHPLYQIIIFIFVKLGEEDC